MEEKIFSKKQIIVIILGVLLTAVSFCFYFLLKINWLNIVCGVICFLYMIFLMYFQLYDKQAFTKKQRILYPTLISVIFYGVIITLITLFNPLGKFCFDYILWALFCGASVIPFFYLLLLIVSYVP